MTSIPYPSQIFISTYKDLKINLIDDHRDNVPPGMEQKFGNLVVRVAMLCNRAIAYTEKEDVGKLGEVLFLLLKDVRKIIDIVKPKNVKAKFKGFNVAIESHISQLEKM